MKFSNDFGLRGPARPVTPIFFRLKRAISVASTVARAPHQTVSFGASTPLPILVASNHVPETNFQLYK